MHSYELIVTVQDLESGVTDMELHGTGSVHFCNVCSTYLYHKWLRLFVSAMKTMLMLISISKRLFPVQEQLIKDSFKMAFSKPSFIEKVYMILETDFSCSFKFWV